MSRILFIALFTGFEALACSYCRTTTSPPAGQNARTANTQQGAVIVRGATPLKSSLSESGEFFKSIGERQNVEIVEDEITVVPSVYQSQ